MVTQEVETALEEAVQPGSEPTYPHVPRDRFHVDPEHREDIDNHLKQFQANMMEYEVGDEVHGQIHVRENHREQEIDSFEAAPFAPRLNYRQQLLDLVEAVSPAVLEQLKKEMGYPAGMAYSEMPPTVVLLAATRNLQEIRHEIDDMDAAHQREMQVQHDAHRRDMRAKDEENARLRQELAAHMDFLAANKSAAVVAKVNDEFERREAAATLVDFSLRAQIKAQQAIIQEQQENIRMLHRQQERNAKLFEKARMFENW